jgi:PAS domain S-box-containing protein
MPNQAQAWVQAAEYLEGRIQSTAEQKPGRPRDMSPAAAHAMRTIMPQIVSSPRAWLLLRWLLASASRADVADGAAAAHAHAAREAAARKIILIHADLVHEMCTPSHAESNNGRPHTQQLPARLPAEDAHFVDQFLREVARRLLGRREGSTDLEVLLDPTQPRQGEVWAHAAMHLMSRLQSADDPMLDLGLAAAEAMNAVIVELGNTAIAWQSLRQLLEDGKIGASTPSPAAAAHSNAARVEAARKLIMNHSNVLQDLLHGPQTDEATAQPVAYKDAVHADAFLREVTRRLLGCFEGANEIEERLDLKFPQQAAAWVQAAAYIETRLKGEARTSRELDTNADRPALDTRVSSARSLWRRAGDVLLWRRMAPTAADAMKAVIGEIRTLASAWLALRVRLDDAKRDAAIGVAAAHPMLARVEAARKIITNQHNVRLDVCNTSSQLNIYGDRMLTQLNLQRVSVESSAFVDQFLREIARRLLGGMPELEARLKLENPQQAMAWIQTAAYLQGRLQTTADQKPGRERDMGPAAGDAMIAVMGEICDSAQAWLTLRQQLGRVGGATRDPEDAAAAHSLAEHSMEAREEAARKLILNHSAVRMDITNPSMSKSINGTKLTQARSLLRLPYADAPHVDTFLRELARRLLGPKSTSRQELRLNPSQPPQARAWVNAAKYLSQRIMSQPQEYPGREPDMSPEAAAAMKAAIAELSALGTEMLADMAARGLVATASAAMAPRTRLLSSENHVEMTPPAEAAAAAAPVASALSPSKLVAQPTLDEGRRAASLAIRQLTKGNDSAFNKWISSKASLSMLEQWNEMLLQSLSNPEALATCCGRHFCNYKLPDDMAGWMLNLCILAESLPLAFCLSDAQTAGFPLIYINKKFSSVTGYSKEECFGRNCRFLQGPSTDPVHGKQLLDTLRAGQDSQIMMVNYRKTGVVFENLLTMAYVRDNHDRRRYCVGLQLDLTGLETDDGPWGAAALSSDEGRALIEETRKKYVKLIKLLPQKLPVPPPAPHVRNLEALPLASGVEGGSGVEWECPQLQKLAVSLGVSMPSTRGTNWVAVLYHLLDQSQHAVVAVDMLTPGLPLDYCNEAFSALTLWPRNEALGKSCRFLQDQKTEPQVLSNMITAIRRHEHFAQRITNVRKDGSHFSNDLSLHPIFDSNNVCRLMVGMLGVASDAEVSPPTLISLRKHLPSSPVDVALMPCEPSKFEPVPVVEQWKEHQGTNTKLIRLLWATEPDGALRQLLAMQPMMAQHFVSSFAQFLAASQRTEDEKLLAKVLEQQRSGAWSPLAGRTCWGE